jgi:hypothetical protein
MPRLSHLVAAAVAVVLGAGVALAVSAQSAVAEGSPAPARVAACTAPAPTTAAGYQAMFDGKHDDTWAGGDQAASVALPDGRELWLFGDTLRGGQMVHSSALLQEGGCLQALPAAAELIPSRADGQWYWPQSATVLGRQLLVFCARVARTGTGAFDFRPTGTDLAVFDLTGGTPRFARVLATPSSDVPETQFAYGAATVREGRWLYVWGSRRLPGAFGRQVAVARVAAGAVDGPWQFWTGSSWSDDRSAARPVADRWSTAFSIWRDGDGLHSLTKQDDVYGHAVVLGTAASPAAAFREHPVLEAPSDVPHDVLLYSALAHPEIRLADGRLLVTVCRNSSDLSRVLADPDLYKPQFAGV